MLRWSLGWYVHAIKKPADFGDTYFCYKKFTAIIVLACVDARGIFTYVNAGRPGSVGDSYTYRHSVMRQNVASGEWHSPRTIEGVSVKPFVVADSAFPLEPTCIKCSRLVGQHPYRHSFKYSLIRTRRVVEQAFGRLKGQWKIMDGRCMVNDPVFARHVAMVCCGLHNVCERHNCAFEPGWLPEESAYVETMLTNLQVTAVVGSASSVRSRSHCKTYSTYSKAQASSSVAIACQNNTYLTLLFLVSLILKYIIIVIIIIIMINIIHMYRCIDGYWIWVKYSRCHCQVYSSSSASTTVITTYPVPSMVFMISIIHDC